MCKVWPATESHDVAFRQIHLADGGRVRVRKVCELDGQEVSAAEIGRGYETATAVIPVTDQDLDSMPVATARTIELAGFLPAASLDPVQIGTAYYRSPDGPAAQKPYTLLRQALERSSRVAVARYSMRDRERLGLLRVVGEVIALHQLRWPDEVRPASAVPAPAVNVTDEEIDAAVELAAALSSGFELAEQRDAYRDAVEEVIAAKEAGRRPEPAAEPLTAGKVVDLMAALRRGRLSRPGRTAGALAASTVTAADASSPATPADAVAQNQESSVVGQGGPSAIPPEDRAKILGSNYRSSSDRAWTSRGDAEGFHLLIAEAKTGYAWRTVASLSEVGFEADSWIGNVCVTQSGKRAAVAYAPRTFTNKPELMVRGAFTAIVDMESGKVTKLPYQATLAYFSPGCGFGEDAVFSQFTHDADKQGGTRLISVDALAGKPSEPLVLNGQVTSAVPTAQGIVAANGRRIVRVDGKSEPVELATARSVPFQLSTDKEGGLTYIERLPTASPDRAEESQALRLTADQIRSGKGDPKPLAKGLLAGWDLSRSAEGTVYVTGSAKTTGKLPTSVKNPGQLNKDAVVSTQGAVVTSTTVPPAPSGRQSPSQGVAPDQRSAVQTNLHVLATGKDVALEAVPGTDPIGSVGVQAEGRETSPALQRGSAKTPAAAQSGSPTDPVEYERTCAVPRNDPKKQAFQPTPRQIEWAVDQAVIGQLNTQISRPANWKNTGMAAYRPQDLFPPKLMEGDTNGTVDDVGKWHIPSQIMLGMTAQESNMWQATRFAVPGVTANPLIGNYYGVGNTADGTQIDPWTINWTEADCGYGVTQVTDGMRLAHTGNILSKTQQEAIALDYTANIAAGTNILVEKWNQTRKAGLKINNGHPMYIENWYFALWAYNSGFYEPGQDPDGGGSHWGVGFTNNPANPLWKYNRGPFLEGSDGKDDYSHAAHPQDWPYQEKVIGWAARPIAAVFSPGVVKPGYVQAWWNSKGFRSLSKPRVDTFCDFTVSCEPLLIRDGDSNDPGKGACTLDKDRTKPHWLHCWWNRSVTWKQCDLGECGYAVHRFNTTYPEQPDESSYPPRCGSDGLPAGSMVIDDLPNGTTPAGSAGRCGPAASNGKFEFQFTSSNGTYPGKMDLHQIGAGENNHFWFSHTRVNAGDGARLFTTGKWSLNEPNIGWARVMVHLPDHGAHTRQAAYLVGGSDSSSSVRVVPQRARSNRWVSLGVFRFTGNPSVSLSTATADGTGDEDIAWDAVAFQKLTDKPRHQVVAMGDSFSSGEGASEGNADYSPETNYRDKQNEATRNACHRSTKAWSRQATAPGFSASIGELEDSYNQAMDYHLIACSGARTYNIDRYPENGELSQIQKGYLDQNTTLVTISIGGNDSRFTDVITACMKAFGSGSCENKAFSSSEPKIDRDVDGDGQIERNRDEPYQGLPMKTAVPDLISKVVRPDILNALEQIHQKAPRAKIALLGYPRLISNGATCLRLGPLGISAESNAWLDKVADHLAGQMTGVALDAQKKGIDVRFGDPRENFADKGICGTPEAIHGIVKTLTDSDDTIKDWPGLSSYGLSAQSFHPKIAGARFYADRLQSTMTGWTL
ncbi:Ku protein [Streptomyces sp. NPDC001581]|uniref:non-homologous end joining protein Ku n=1 Tax=Streptomyces sp. NPDC001581 TaxID=3154386 RepID=UPI003320B0CD